MNAVIVVRTLGYLIYSPTSAPLVHTCWKLTSICDTIILWEATEHVVPEENKYLHKKLNNYTESVQ